MLKLQYGSYLRRRTGSGLNRAYVQRESATRTHALGVHVFSLKRSESSKGMWLGALIGAVLVAAPSLAEAQAHGTLQATAVVVNTAPAMDALRSAQAVAKHWVTNRHHESTVATLATITVREDSRTGSLRELVVTIDYSRN